VIDLKFNAFVFDFSNVLFSLCQRLIRRHMAPFTVKLTLHQGVIEERRLTRRNA